MENSIVSRITSMHLYAWEKGLKTGVVDIAAQKALKRRLKFHRRTGTI
jgi:hypothetical protein